MSEVSIDDGGMRMLSDNELDLVDGGIVCGGWCIAGVVAGVVVLAGGVYVGYKGAED